MIDHHVDKESDVGAGEVIVEHVGSVSTIVTEMLQQATRKAQRRFAALCAHGAENNGGSGPVSEGPLERVEAERCLRVLELSDLEATLLALGVHADTGSLTYDSAGPRDGKALAWLMECGASQVDTAAHV